MQLVILVDWSVVTKVKIIRRVYVQRAERVRRDKLERSSYDEDLFTL